MAHKKDTDRAVIAAPFGRVAITINAGVLVDVGFPGPRARLHAAQTPLGRRLCAQLRGYLANPHTRFDVPLQLAATPHQRRVWRALQRIPAGAVVSYGVLARRLKSSARAVGGACRANPVPLVIPCHRVVSASGDGGFMGKTGGPALRIKRWLLAHERAR